MRSSRSGEGVFDKYQTARWVVSILLASFASGSGAWLMTGHDLNVVAQIGSLLDLPASTIGVAVGILLSRNAEDYSILVVTIVSALLNLLVYYWLAGLILRYFRHRVDRRTSGRGMTV